MAVLLSHLGDEGRRDGSGWRMCGYREGTEGRLIDGTSWETFRKDGYWIRTRARKEWLSSQARNRRIKSSNGNRGNIKQNLKLFHWNMGHSWWEQKRNEIQAAVLEIDPDLIFITEANLREGVDDAASHIEGYEMVLPATMATQGYARIILLVREGVKYRRMVDFMDDQVATIWIKLEIRGKPMHIGGM